MKDEENNNVKTELTIDSGYIKLSKNSRGHTWDIKLLVGAKQEDYDKLLVMVKELDNSLDNTYGALKLGVEK